MVAFKQDAWLWYEHPEQSWIPVKMIGDSGKVIQCRSANNEQFDIPSNVEYDMVQSMGALRSVDNMVELEELSEAAILHNLRLRFDDNVIYTYISSILVSINPFKQLNIYGSVDVTR